MTDASTASSKLVRRYFRLYPGEAARHLNTLPTDEILRLLADEEIAVAARLYLRLNPGLAARAAEMMEDVLFVALFSEIDPVRGAALLSRLSESIWQKRLKKLPDHLAREYAELLTYPPNTAGRLMDPNVLTFQPAETIEVVLDRLRSAGDRQVIDLCVIDEEGVLRGVVPLQIAAVAPASQPIGDLIHREPVTVNMMDPREDVVQVLEERKLATLPVVTLDGKLLGVIRHDALVAAAQQDVTEGLQAMFGAGRDEQALSKASLAIRKRLPWLEINLATAFLASAVVGMFEDTIARITALAVFLPVVAGQSGNTGSQALAVTMRGLALREIRTRHWFRVVRKEMTVGFVNGCAVALTTALIVFWWESSYGLAVVIGVSMVISMVIAGLSGAVIPIILRAIGQDPAQSSSIILTTVTDVVGFMSFLGLATLLSAALGIV